MTTEKKVEFSYFPVFKQFLSKAFKGLSVGEYYGHADYPTEISKALENATKNPNGKGKGSPDAIFLVQGTGGEKYLFVFEAKAKNVKQAESESKHYCQFLSDITNNIYSCSVTDTGIKVVAFKSDKELELLSIPELENETTQAIFKTKLNELNHIPQSEQAKTNLKKIIENLNNNLRKVGLAGQDRIDFASSLFLVKEIYDAVSQDFRDLHFSTIIKSPDIFTTLKKINEIATREDIKKIFPDFSHLIIEDQLINIEKFNKIIPKDDSENNIKAS